MSSAASPHRLALELALTIRHDGHGGVADDLATAGGLAAWLQERAAPLAEAGARVRPGSPPDRATLDAVRELRAAVRALFARAVRPGPPSRADAHRLMSPAQALERLNAAVARVPVVTRLDWPEGGDPVLGTAPASPGVPTAAESLTAALARDAIAFLAGPERARLRACPAPRCVRYFVQDHPRQEWCKPSCGNRARVARHQRRRREAAEG
ncbi:CGNR zinc finger domain-containing protein [Streptomyces hoynatensis]|uniref:Zinc finger CGNR domain-containing protein n=1 Tax=Streptomyces hoynatensis TaxID=1141874 RepID=A0A3A9Z9P6_9ACTN|nr:ABATE domain-containing protein [Streptomyces hoynatensis]RKN44975.1 hypothetical protein D7294_07695 [Streptomyces hoynatensis]